MGRIIYIIGLITLLLSAQQLRASYTFNDNCKVAYQEIIFLKFQSAHELLIKEKKLNPQNDIPYYLENYIAFLQLFIGEDPSDIKKFELEKSIILKRLEKGDTKSPYYKYCLADFYLQWAFIHVKSGDYKTAAFEISKAYRLLEANTKQFPTFILNKKGMGLLHALIGSIPESFKWAVAVTGMSGSVENGIDEMFSVFNAACTVKEYDYLKTETLFMLSFLQLNLQAGENRLSVLNKSFERIKTEKIINSPLLIYCRSIVALKTFNAQLAEKLLLQYKIIAGQYPFYYLYYLTGLSKLSRLDPVASGYFSSYLNNYKGRSYKIAARQKLAWTYLIQGNSEKYKAQMKLIIGMPISPLDEDKQAVAEASSGLMPNILLLKARLLFDGGYFEKAYGLLINSNTAKLMISKRDQLEYIYRLARITHEWKRLQEAITYYNKTIEKGRESTYYFAANAALQLGEIYELQKNYTFAVVYYKMAMSMKNTEYVNSISQKAKAGINRIEKKTGNH